MLDVKLLGRLLPACLTVTLGSIGTDFAASGGVYTLLDSSGHSVIALDNSLGND
jgi:hypothetical protein